MRRIPFESSWILLLQFFFCSDQHEYIILWFNEFFFLLWRCMTWPNRFYQVVKFAYFLQWFCVDCDQWEYANRREKQKKCIVESRRNRGCCSSDSMAHVRRTITCVSRACVYRLMTPPKKKETYNLWLPLNSQMGVVASIYSSSISWQTVSSNHTSNMDASKLKMTIGSALVLLVKKIMTLLHLVWTVYFLVRLCCC